MTSKKKKVVVFRVPVGGLILKLAFAFSILLQLAVIVACEKSQRFLITLLMDHAYVVVNAR